MTGFCHKFIQLYSKLIEIKPSKNTCINNKKSDPNLKTNITRKLLFSMTLTKAHRKTEMNLKISKNERYLNILERIFQLLKETQEYHDWHFSEKEVNRISNNDYAPYAIEWRNAARQTNYGFTKLQAVF